MISYLKFFKEFGGLGLDWLDAGLGEKLDEKLSNTSNKDLARWNKALGNILRFVDADAVINYDNNRINITGSNLDDTQRKQLSAQLKAFCPWRKGPFWLHGIHIDTEWRSDFKWNRVLPHISSLKNRLVLDVGCGNGYHCFRMAEEGAKAVLGADPFLLSVLQFWVISTLSNQKNVCVLPMGVDDVPQEESFDTVFSMGLLYHRKSPIDHLFQLKGFLRPGGEMVLETLVIEGEDGMVLVPSERYAMMRNVWFVPSVETLRAWIDRVGFRDVRLVDLNRTTTDEQRRTEWMTFDSLADFLDPDDSSLTKEGYPAPLRAVFVATKSK